MNPLSRLALRVNHREQGSLPLAILLTIIVTAVIMVGTATAITAAKKTQVSRDYALAQQAADAAVADVLMKANQQEFASTGADESTQAAALAADEQETGTGQVGAVRWTWKVDKASVADYQVSIDVRNDSGTVTRSFDVELTRTQVQSADTKTNKPRYQVAEGAGFSVGFFANRQMILSPATAVSSYDRATGEQNSGHGRISSNGSISLSQHPGGNATADVVTLYNSTNAPYTGRCTGDPCRTIPLQTHPVNFNLHSEKIAARCNTMQPMPYVASIDGALTEADNGNCYSAMTFDQDTTISGTVKVYASGDISVLSGVSVNSPSTGSPAAERLSIYTAGEHVTINGGGSNAQVAWRLWAPNADCTGGQGGAVSIAGSMLCDRLITQGVWTLRHDEAAATLAADPLTRSDIWAVTRYAEQD